MATKLIDRPPPRQVALPCVDRRLCRFVQGARELPGIAGRPPRSILAAEVDCDNTHPARDGLRSQVPLTLARIASRLCGTAGPQSLAAFPPAKQLAGRHTGGFEWRSSARSVRSVEAAGSLVELRP